MQMEQHCAELSVLLIDAVALTVWRIPRVQKRQQGHSASTRIPLACVPDSVDLFIDTTVTSLHNDCFESQEHRPYIKSSLLKGCHFSQKQSLVSNSVALTSKMCLQRVSLQRIITDGSSLYRSCANLKGSVAVLQPTVAVLHLPV